MISPLKNFGKGTLDTLFRFLFRYRRTFPFLRLYPRAKEYCFDIINHQGNNESDVILDVGANIGQSARLFRKLFPDASIHCFEPIDETCRTLEDNVKHQRNIHVHNIALGHTADRFEVLYEANSGTNSLIGEVNSKAGKRKTQTVQVQRMDSFCKARGIEHVHLLKIDTEGFDLNVLQGASEMLDRQAVDFIVCEIGFLYEENKGNFEDINQFLRSKNYRFSAFYNHYYWGRNFIMHGFANAMFVRQELTFE